MAVPVETALEKIRENEHDKEKLLQEQREVDATIAALTHSINETKKHGDRAQKEIKLLTKKSEDTRIQLELRRLQYAAISTQVKNGETLIEHLQTKTESSTFEIWKMRKKYNDISHDLLENYDIWALMTKPRHQELSSSIAKVHNIEDKDDVINKSVVHLKSAMERRDKARSEILKLRKEPEIGEEFIRKRKAIDRELGIGEKVYMKNLINENKLVSEFNPTPHTVISAEGSDINIRNDETGQEYRRNIVHLKKVEDQWKVVDREESSDKET